MAKPRKTLIYGCHGDGKSTWAASGLSHRSCRQKMARRSRCDSTKLLKSPVEVVEVINELLAIEDNYMRLSSSIRSIGWRSRSARLSTRRNSRPATARVQSRRRRIGVVLKCWTDREGDPRHLHRSRGTAYIHDSAWRCIHAVCSTPHEALGGSVQRMG